MAAALRLVLRLSRSLALAGGLVLLALTVLTVVSVLGRSLFGQPVRGDVELVEQGVAIAIFLFLPYAHLSRGNVVVEALTTWAGPVLRRRLTGLGDLLYALVAALLCWRLVLGALDLRRYHETTMVLQLPVWWTFVPILIAAALLTLVCALTAYHQLFGRESR